MKKENFFFFNSLGMKNKLFAKFKDINKTLSIILGQNMNFSII